MHIYLIPKTEFSALLENAGASSASKENVWFTIADRILREWNGVSYSFLDALTPGQSVLVCCAQFYRGAKHDFLGSVTESEIPSRTLKAFELLGAQEYGVLLRQVEAVFPGQQFPQYAEDMLSALRKQPDGYFEAVAEKFVSGKDMPRPLCDYVFDYLTTHREDFSGES